MQWTDEAIVLAVQPFAEHAARVSVFSKTQGRFVAMVRGAQSAKQRGVYMPGNGVQATWRARLAEHMGQLTCELAVPYAAYVLADAARLDALHAMCTLLEYCLPEREAHPQLYAPFERLLQALQQQANWPEAYAMLEWTLLSECGFGLDLRNCAATGSRENLVYVSPRSGRAVSEDAGAPYRDRLLPLPACVYKGTSAQTVREAIDVLVLTGYFLHKYLLQPHGRQLPAARERLVRRLQATADTATAADPMPTAAAVHR